MAISKYDIPVQVSVLMLTYNHGLYLETAVRSVLRQKCQFPFEIVIGDDCSTDNTLEIARNLQAEAPELIRVLSAKVNLGITPNFLRILDSCQGRYVAMLEGDDFWIDDEKLQRQFDLMESDSSLSLCTGKTQNRFFWSAVKPKYSLPELLSRYLFHTSTLFFRKHDVPDFAGFEKLLALDSLLITFLLEKGDCGFIDKELSYYRRHEGGAWTGKKLEQQVEAAQQVTDALSVHFGGRFDKELSDRELWIYGMMISVKAGIDISSQWKSSLSLIGPIMSRNVLLQPAKSMRAILSIIGQPFIAGFQQLRFKLKLGTRMRELLDGK